MQGPLRDYRNSLIYGGGLDAGISGDGAIFIGEVLNAKPGVVLLSTAAADLRLTAEPSGERGTLQHYGPLTYGGTLDVRV